MNTVALKIGGFSQQPGEQISVGDFNISNKMTFKQGY